MRKILLLLVLSVIYWFQTGTPIGVAESHAQVQRPLPVNGKRGATGEARPLPQVIIGRETLTLAPGGLIYDTHNRTIVHSALPVGADVWYQLNPGGQIQRIYILRPDEQTRLNQARK